MEHHVTSSDLDNRFHTPIPVTIGVVNYNGKATLPNVLAALKSLEYPDIRIVVIDDASQDGSPDYVETFFPEIKLIGMENNRGPAVGRNRILQSAETDLILLLDNDVIPEPDMLWRLVDVMHSDPDIAICHPELEDPSDPYVYHYNGGYNHYLCALVSRDKPVPGENRLAYEVFPVIAGGALLINRMVVEKVGGFDEDYYFNMEDGDFTARLTLAGYKVVNVPTARATHKGKLRGTSRVYYQVRNRWHFILKLYSWRTVFFVLPALLFYDFSQGIFLGLKGAGREWLRGTLAGIRDIPCILRKRRAFSPLKKRRDREWLKAGELYVPGALLKGGFIGLFKRISDRLYSAYWKLVLPFIP